MEEVVAAEPNAPALELAEHALAVTMSELNEKKAVLKAVEDDLQALQDHLRDEYPCLGFFDASISAPGERGFPAKIAPSSSP